MAWVSNDPQRRNENVQNLSMNKDLELVNSERMHWVTTDPVRNKNYDRWKRGLTQASGERRAVSPAGLDVPVLFGRMRELVQSVLLYQFAQRATFLPRQLGRATDITVGQGKHLFQLALLECRDGLCLGLTKTGFEI